MRSNSGRAPCHVDPNVPAFRTYREVSSDAMHGLRNSEQTIADVARSSIRKISVPPSTFADTVSSRMSLPETFSPTTLATCSAVRLHLENGHNSR